MSRRRAKAGPHKGSHRATLGSQTLARIRAKALKAAGLPHISMCEDTKHSFATNAIRRGVPERHRQRFLGHKNVQSTRRYARLADNALGEVLRAPP